MTVRLRCLAEIVDAGLNFAFGHIAGAYLSETITQCSTDFKHANTDVRSSRIKTTVYDPASLGRLSW